MFSFKSCLALAGAAVALASCAGSTAMVTSPAIQKAQSGELPAPTDADLQSGTRPYFIGPLDKLVISVFGVEELEKVEVQADASGNISFPLIGVVEAGGKTPSDVASMIESRLARRYIKNPQVTVNLEETVSQVVTVEGEVKEPGIFPVAGRMTLLRAVARAKGTTEFASSKNVVVFRTVDGQRMAALYNLQAVRRGNYPDPEIYPNDVVVVGDSEARRLFREMLQLAPALSAAVVTFVR
jgi:polysaccharide biosynthesis/export protein